MGRTSQVAASLSPDSSAGEVVLHYVRAQTTVLRAREAGVRAHDSEAVHKTRVATRRLRTTLRVFHRLLHQEHIEPLRSELQWYSRRLGEVRDLDIVRDLLLQTLTDLHDPSEEEVRHSVETTVDRAREHACVRLDEALNSQRYTDLIAALDDLCARPPWRGRAHRRARRVLPELVKEATKRVNRARTRADEATDPDDRRALRHDTRKRAKAVRYAHEALAEALGARSTARAKRWEAVTEDLGADQDLVTARIWLDRITAEAVAEGADTAPFARLSAALTLHSDARE